MDVSGAVAFWDITNREDYHVVEMQQQGTRSRSWTAGTLPPLPSQSRRRRLTRCRVRP